MHWYRIKWDIKWIKWNSIFLVEWVARSASPLVNQLLSHPRAGSISLSPDMESSSGPQVMKASLLWLLGMFVHLFIYACINIHIYLYFYLFIYLLFIYLMFCLFVYLDIYWFIYWLIDWFIAWLIDLLIDWLIY